MNALVLETYYDNAAVDDEAGVVECNVDVKFVPDGKVMTVAATGSIKTERTYPPPEDCFTGPRVYRLVGGAVVADD